MTSFLSFSGQTGTRQGPEGLYPPLVRTHRLAYNGKRRRQVSWQEASQGQRKDSELESLPDILWMPESGKDRRMIKQPQREQNALWKQRYQTAELRSPQIARRRPVRGLVVSSASGTGQLYAWDVPSGKLRQLTHRPEGTFSGYISPDGSFVYYLDDHGGNERGHYVRLPWEGGDAQTLTAELPPYSALYRCAVSSDGMMFVFTPTQTRSFPLYCLDLQPDGTVGSVRELHRSPKFIDDAAVSFHAEIAVVATTEYAMARQYSLLAFETASGRRIGELADLPGGSVRAILFSPVAGDLRLLCTTDRSGFTRPCIWQCLSGERKDLLLEELAGDVEPLDWSRDSRYLLLHQIWHARSQLYRYDLETGMLTRLEHPQGACTNAAFGADGQILATWTDSTHSKQILALDPTTGANQGTLLVGGDTPPARPFTSISFRSSDGVEVQAWLALPDGVGPFPTILALHGGPHVVRTEAYDPDAQCWLDHGYAYLSLNYRGSTTFGREFKEKVWGDMGHWEVEDMVAAHAWLLREGISRPDAILVTGVSGGGYLTLMALGKHPELWAGGMALLASADFTSEFYEGTDWTRGFLTAMMGGTPADKPEQYILSSPITYAEHVKAPLLVIQGHNDLRCPPQQMRQYAEKMRSLGKPFEIEWCNIGHSGVANEQWIAFQERMLCFAYRVLTALR
jgi:dipeptidyl aminopeptidase/acylaminoacyl peptidase